MDTYSKLKYAAKKLHQEREAERGRPPHLQPTLGCFHQPIYRERVVLGVAERLENNRLVVVKLIQKAINIHL